MSSHAAGLQPLTLAQRDVVLADDARLLVGAGAGSGKTSTIVQKLCYLLGGRVTDVTGAAYVHASPIALSDIAAITFTNEAAADLKRKLRAALVASGLRHLAPDVDAARIGTIHGFCGELLREFALRAGLPPTLSVLPDGETDALAADCAQRAVQRAALGRHDPQLDSLLTGRTLADVTRLVVEVAADSDRLRTWSANSSKLRDHERALLTIAERALQLRRDELEQVGAMDFDRMIVAVRDLLRDDSRVRHAVQRQLRLLIIDEFQDVDPAQRDLAFLLGGLSYDDAAPTRIMLVGDPKQSIYKFRRADVSLWNSVASTFATPATGRRLELGENFRSRKGILGLVDMTIGAKLSQPINPERSRQSFEVDYVPLAAAGPDADGDRCVELIGVPPLDDGKPRKVRDARAIEANAVAARIRELHNDGAGYGEMAILLTAFGDVDIYRDALRAHGVPVYVLRGEGFWETREVLDCILALRAIRDRADDVALVGFLKGPLVGVRDETLLALRDARHANGLRGAVDDVSLPLAERDLCNQAAQLLSRYDALRDRIPVHELLQRLVAETGLVATLLLDAERGAQAVANIRKLVRVAASSADLSLGEFLRDVREARLRGDRVGEERLYRERADVVTITTVHSAKGLEWPIVFWCDVSRGGHDRSDKLACGRELFRLKLEVGEEDDEGKIIDPEHAALRDALREEDLSESLRVWYVAATRARRLLVLCGIPIGEKIKSANSMAGELRSHFESLQSSAPAECLRYRHADGTEFDVVVRIAQAVTVPEGAPVAPRAFTLPLSATMSPPRPIATRRGRTRLSATQLMAFASDPESWWRRYVFGFEPTERVEHSTASRSSATIGTIVHDLLERYNFELADIQELIESAIERLDPDAPESSTESGQSFRRQLADLVAGATSSAAWQELASQPTARRELPFTRVLNDGSVIDGALDLVAIDDGQARILDVKTGGAKSDAEFAERYRVQAAVYNEIVRAIANVPASFALLRASDGRELKVDGASVDVTALIEKLRQYQK